MKYLMLFILTLSLNSMIILTDRVSIILNKPSLQSTTIKKELQKLNIKVRKDNQYLSFTLIKRDSSYKNVVDFKNEVINIFNSTSIKNTLSKDEITQIASLAKGGKIIFYMPKECKIDKSTWCYFNSKTEEKIINKKVVLQKSCTIPKNKWVSIDSNVRVSFKDNCPLFYVTR